MGQRLFPAIFLDKDGTLIENDPYNVEPSRMRLTAGAAQALSLLHRAGYLLFVVSNQPGVAEGRFPEAALRGVEEKLKRLFGESGARLCRFYYCPHAQPEEGKPACDCRKPSPGMLLEAQDDYDLDLARSWMVGDILDDVEAGNRAGCRSILVDTGGETQWKPGPQREPYTSVGNLLEAATLIMNEPAQVKDEKDATEEGCRRAA